MLRTFGILSAIGALLLISDCKPLEGERCNPLLFSDECTDGLTCTYPTHCAVAYCCPLADQVTPDNHANCQRCPPPDAGTD